MESTLVDFLKDSHYSGQRVGVRRKKIDVPPGQSVVVEDFEYDESEESDGEEDDEPNPTNDEVHSNSDE